MKMLPHKKQRDESGCSGCGIKIGKKIDFPWTLKRVCLKEESYSI